MCYLANKLQYILPLQLKLNRLITHFSPLEVPDFLPAFSAQCLKMTVWFLDLMRSTYPC